MQSVRKIIRPGSALIPAGTLGPDRPYWLEHDTWGSMPFGSLNRKHTSKANGLAGSAGRHAGRLGPLWSTGPYFDQQWLAEFKISGLKPPPLPSPQLPRGPWVPIRPTGFQGSPFGSHSRGTQVPF